MSVLSIQSQTVLGRSGNSIASFVLQRLGVETLAVPSVVYSNDPDLGAFTGRAYSTEEIDELVAGIEDQGALRTCDAVLSGYIAATGAGEAVARAVARVRAANAGAFYCCDPVLGDAPKGLAVSRELADFVRDRMVAEAEVITPNCFELGWLTGKPVSTPATVFAAAKPLASRPRFVVITGVATSDRTLGLMLVTPDGGWIASTPKRQFQRQPSGGGDLTAAVFLAHLLRTQDPVASLGATAGSVYAVFAATQAGESELALLTAQDALARPATSFPVERVA